MRHQRGASYIAVLIAVAGFAFLAKIIVTVWSPYFDDRMINDQIAEEIRNSPKNITPMQFANKMNQRFSMNGLLQTRFEDVAQVNVDNGLQVKTNYEVRKPFVLNIDLVLKFEKNFDQNSVKTE